MPTESLQTFRNEELRNREIASAYLSDAFETGTPREIAIAIRHVLEANGTSAESNDAGELVQLRLLGLHISVTSTIARSLAGTTAG